MISKSFFISIVLLLGVTMTSVRADEAQEVSAALSKFFSLFETDCSNWVQVFTKSASFSHPKFPSGIVGSQALLDFCGKAKAAAQVQEFRQDGGAMLTREGDFLHVLVPYVYATIDPKAPFINSGFESIKLVSTPAGYKILSVIEFFTRNPQPYVWPANR